MKRTLKKQDLVEIRRGVRKLYDGPGVPYIEIGEKYFCEQPNETFFNHSEARIRGRNFDLHDMFDLNSALTASGCGDPELKISPGFVFDLYIYEGMRRDDPYGRDHGDMWGNLDAEWTGKEWKVVWSYSASTRE